ncbi:ankyrin repeat-containing protein BDA1-like isoform X3 [Lycium ferocissimum]|uniref:ankyrin repeat-containing protein BDA1-like isoform X3 n=1 Tax=Lycium ferocissimum TaxID=112874 RepID=UPI002815BFE9|nr:ankyrin repeat-containing protein BDA1-like isoform X3 [Lycium ferocissimum]
MDSKLFDASRTGNVAELMEILRSDPIIVRPVGLADGDSPLHLACLGGHFNFVKELLKLRKEFAGELNQNGFSCLHIAAANGDLLIVKEILNMDIGLCLVKGRERRIPLHYAIIKGRVDVIKELRSASVESIEVVTSRGETALHLAVKNGQFEALEVLIKHINTFSKTEVFNKQDELGNGVLHLAAARKQHEVVDLLLNGSLAASWAIGVNSLNKMGFTALDVFSLSQSEAGDREIEDILRRAGGLKAADFGGMPATPIIYPQICASNSQHGVQQPNYQIEADPNKNTNDNVNVDLLIRYSSHIFLFFNSLGFFISLHVFHIVTRAFPLRFELLLSVFALVITYISCLLIKLPRYFCYYLCVGIPFLLVFALSLSRLGDLHPRKFTTATHPSMVNQA